MLYMQFIYLIWECHSCHILQSLDGIIICLMKRVDHLLTLLMGIIFVVYVVLGLSLAKA